MTTIYCSYDVASPRVWCLERPYTRETSIGKVTVPSGFFWDGASVPRYLWSFTPTWGSYSGAALVHDALYATRRGSTDVTISASSTNTITRKEADRVFRELMRDDRVWMIMAWAMWMGVRSLGWKPWDYHTTSWSRALWRLLWEWSGTHVERTSGIA